MSVAASAFVGVPKFESFDSHGNKGTLYLFNVRPASTSGAPRASTVHLVKVMGAWRLADDELLKEQAARIQIDKSKATAAPGSQGG